MLHWNQRVKFSSPPCPQAVTPRFALLKRKTRANGKKREWGLGLGAAWGCSRCRVLRHALSEVRLTYKTRHCMASSPRRGSIWWAVSDYEVVRACVLGCSKGRITTCWNVWFTAGERRSATCTKAPELSRPTSTLSFASLNWKVIVIMFVVLIEEIILV